VVSSVLPASPIVTNAACAIPHSPINPAAIIHFVFIDLPLF